MITGLSMTAINIVLDIMLVLHFGLGAVGIAYGTFIAEVFGFLVGFGFVLVLLRRDRLLDLNFSVANMLDTEKLQKTLPVNRDIFIRTFLLAFSFAWFVQRGSAFGDVTLAANQILLQLFLFTGLALDGTAIAAETLVGRVIGNALSQSSLARYDMIVRRSFVMACGGAVVFMVGYLVFGNELISMLTSDEGIHQAAIRYLPWVIVSPLVVMVCFQLDGVFVGATRSKEMRNSMIVSVLVFLPISLWAGASMGNHGVWFAFSFYFFLRAVTLAFYMPRIRQSFLP